MRYGDLEKRRAWSKAYYIRNSERIKEQAKRWASNNPEHAKSLRKAWISRNPERRKAISRKGRVTRRMRQLGQIHPLHSQAQERYMIEQCLELKARTGIEHHLDHIIPVASGGWHHHDNMQPLPAFINHQKGNNPLWEHPDFKSWRDVPESLWPETLRGIYQKLKETPKSLDKEAKNTESAP